MYNKNIVNITKNNFNEIMRCSKDPEYFIENYLKILVKENGEDNFKHFKLFKNQKKILKNLVENKNNVVLPYRQAGVTTLINAFCAWRITFHNDFKIAVTSNKLDTAQTYQLLEIKKFIEQLPDLIKPLLKSDRKNYLVYDNGSRLNALSSDASEYFCNHPFDLIVMDNFAYFKGGQTFFNTAILNCTTDGGMIICSTPNGVDNPFCKICIDAQNNFGDFKLSEICWYEDERYNSDLTWEKNGMNETDFFKKLKADGYKPTSSWYRKQCENLSNKEIIAEELDNEFIVKK